MRRSSTSLHFSNAVTSPSAPSASAPSDDERAAPGLLQRLSSGRISPVANRYRQSMIVIDTTSHLQQLSQHPQSQPSPKALVKQPSQRQSSPDSYLQHHIRMFSKRGSLLEQETPNEANGSSPTKSSISTVSQAKLPQQFRQRVSRLRSQFAFVGSPTSSPNTNKREMEIGATTTTATTETKYSRRSTIMQSLHDQLQEQKRRHRTMTDSQEDNTPLKTTYESAGTFQDLLRPLQRRLRKVAEEDDSEQDSSDDEEDEEEDEQALQEAQQSRVYRICCSLDNLLLSIGDQMAVEKRNEALARGAARQLTELLQNAITQIVNSDPLASKASDEGEDTIEALEWKHTKTLLLEIADRMGRLDMFIRSTFVQEVQYLEKRVATLQQQNDSLRQENEKLQVEMVELREFHSHNNRSNLVFQSEKTKDDEFMSPSGSNPRFSLMFRPEKTNENQSLSEVEALQHQCQEYARLLEMAKNEIRLCHRENSVQRDRIAQLSDAVFKDREVLMLRNELTTERRRVKFLEIENVSLRETQHDQQLKIQSLLLNSKPNISTGATTKPPLTSTEATEVPSDANAKSIQNRPTNQEESISIIDSLAQSPSRSPMSAKVDDRCFFYRLIRYPEALTPPAPAVQAPPPPPKPKSRFSSGAQPPPEAPTAPSLKQFVSSYLIPEAQWLALQQQHRVARPSTLPSITPPSLSISSSSTSSTSTSAPSTREGSKSSKRLLPMKRSKPVLNNNESVDRGELLMCCRQLIYICYQRFLMALEAQSFVPSTQSTTLVMIVLEYFMERRVQDDQAAVDACLFVQALTTFRTECGDIALFCDFVEAKRSHDELIFMLWVLHALQEVAVGIDYDQAMDPASPSTEETTYVCALKATFLTRSIFRLLQFKQPHALGSGKRRSATAIAALMLAPVYSSVSTVSTSATLARKRSLKSPKKKRKNDDEPPASTIPITRSDSDRSSDSTPIHATTASTTEPTLIEQARAAFRAIVETNGGFPPSLEAFNALLLQFAIVPSQEELQMRLGPFYHATGDERKLPLDVFVSLTLEMFGFQVKWQEWQFRWLFMTLHREQEAEALAEVQRLEQAANEAISTKKVRNQPNEEKPKPVKKKKKKDKLVKADDTKYQKGLSRKMLHDLLLQAGLVSEWMVPTTTLATSSTRIDLDRLLVQLLDFAHATADDITVDQVLMGLRHFGFFHVVGQFDGQHAILCPLPFSDISFVCGDENDMKKRHTALQTLRDLWHLQARDCIALCEADRNPLVHKQTESMLQLIDRTFASALGDHEAVQVRAAKSPQRSKASFPKEPVNLARVWWQQLSRMRNFLNFAWQIASKRASESQWKEAMTQAPTNTKAITTQASCLSELYFINRALMLNVQSPSDIAVVHEQRRVSYGSMASRLITAQTNDLSVFSDVSQMALEDLFTLNRPIQSKLQLQLPNGSLAIDARELKALEQVLQVYALHLAHLFASFATADKTKLFLLQWMHCVEEINCCHERYMPLQRASALFVYMATRTHGSSPSVISRTDGLCIDRGQFTELLLRVAVERHVATVRKKELYARLKFSRDSSSLLQIAHIMAAFCQHYVIPHAFVHRQKLQEEDFVRKLRCPLVARVLLEHRAFLRSVFFYYSKQGNDEDEEEEETASSTTLQTPALHGFQLGKTKRNSMSLDEFTAFLTEFELLDPIEIKASLSRVLDADMAAYVFRSVMTLENADTTQLEFHEFTAAIAAIAAMKLPNPFVQWHVKIDFFVHELQQHANKRQQS